MAFTIGSGAAPIGTGAISSNTFSSSNIGSGAAPFSAPIGSGATPSNTFPSFNIGSGATPSSLFPPSAPIDRGASPSFSRPSPDPLRPSAFSISSTNRSRPVAVTIGSHHHSYHHDHCHDPCETETNACTPLGCFVAFIIMCLMLGVGLTVYFLT